jgi:hypothetical protein
MPFFRMFSNLKGVIFSSLSNGKNCFIVIFQNSHQEHRIMVECSIIDATTRLLSVYQNSNNICNDKILKNSTYLYLQTEKETYKSSYNATIHGHSTLDSVDIL